MAQQLQRVRMGGPGGVVKRGGQQESVFHFVYSREVEKALHMCMAKRRRSESERGRVAVMQDVSISQLPDICSHWLSLTRREYTPLAISSPQTMLPAMSTTTQNPRLQVNRQKQNQRFSPGRTQARKPDAKYSPGLPVVSQRSKHSGFPLLRNTLGAVNGFKTMNDCFRPQNRKDHRETKKKNVIFELTSVQGGMSHTRPPKRNATMSAMF